MTQPTATEPTNMRPDDLLAGPRGRRLCLLYATQDAGPDSAAAEELRVAAMYASMGRSNDGGGTRYVSAASYIGDVPASGVFQVPDVSPGEVAHLLHTVPLAQPNDRAMIRSLADAVDNARYWQEPDDEDVLLALPEIRAALPRIAELIVSSAENLWWMTRADAHTQWVVAFPPSRAPTPPDSLTTVQRLDRWRAAAIEEESTAQRDRPTDPTKRYSGTWWSAPVFAATATTRALPELGPVGMWLVEDSFGDDIATASRVAVPADATIYEITDAEAWAELCRRYPLEVTASRRHDWYRTTGRAGRWVIPDWSQVAEDYDAVHLTVAAYLSAAGRAIPVDEDRASVIAGWDPDKTYWLRDIGEAAPGDTANAAARDTERWQYDQDTELWAATALAD